MGVGAAQQGLETWRWSCSTRSPWMSMLTTRFMLSLGPNSQQLASTLPEHITLGFSSLIKVIMVLLVCCISSLHNS